MVAGRGRITRLPGEAGEILPGGEGVGVRGSEHLLADGEQFRELVAGRGWVTRLPGEAGEIRPGGEGVGVRGSEDLLDGGEQCVYWSRAAAGSPAAPVKRARFARVVRVSGCGVRETSSGWGAVPCTGRGPRPGHPPPR